MQQPTKQQALSLLWQKGNISWKLHKAQKDLYDSYIQAQHKTVVWLCSRRLGKSFCLLTTAIEQCLKTPNSIVKYIAPTQKHVKFIIHPIIKQILEDCPKAIRPEFRTADNIYRFANGSEIQMAGTDSGHAESLRGGSSHLCIVDEAGFCDDLRYIVQSILIPTTTTTRGKIILSSTPPISPDHDFAEHYVKEAEYRGSLVKKTVYENPLLTKEMIDEIIREYGGADSPEFRREYMCEILTSEEHAIVPEFAKYAVDIIKEWPTPPHRDLYVAGDIGFKDLTVFLFAYYDFRHNKVVVEDEIVMSGQKMTTAYMAEQIKKKETDLWIHPINKEQQKPYLRVCDNNLIVINDLHALHQLEFIPTQKDDALAALNQMRIKVKDGSLIIHPRCKSLIFHLKNGVWNKSKKSFNRSPDAGHYDAIDALKYLIRNIQYTKNPYPHNWDGAYGENVFMVKKDTVITPTANKFTSIFKIKRSLTDRFNK